MRRAAIVGALAAVGCAGGGDAPPPGSEFWREREASYRDSPRGPFTAIHAEYLTYGEHRVIYADESGVSSEPRGEDAIRIDLQKDWGFVVRPVDRYEAGSLDGEIVDEGHQVGDEDADVRVGRFLISLGMQGPETGRILVYDPELLESFHGFDVFPEDERYRVEAGVVAAPGDTLTLGTSRGLEKDYVAAAVLEFEVEGVACRLTGFRAPGIVKGPLFVPYRDATSGADTYGVGRYLRVEAEPGAETATIDFNRSTNPWCAYSPFYNCVLPPEGNRLTVAIRAGERAPEGH